MRTTGPISSMSVVSGNPYSIPYFDSLGDLDDSPTLNIDSNTGGLFQSKTFQPNNVTGYFTLNSAYISVNPLQNSPDDTYAAYQPQIDFDTASSGFTCGTSGEAATMYAPNFRHKGSGNIGAVNFSKNNFDLGNGTDPITVKGVAYSLGFGSFQDGVTVNGPLQGYGFQPSATASVTMTPAAYTNVFYDFSNIGCSSPGWASFSAVPQIAEIQNNGNYSGANFNPTIPLFTGNAGATIIGISGNYGTFGTGSWNGMQVNPTVTAGVNATGIYVNMDNATVSGNKLALDVVGDVAINGGLSFTGGLSIGQLNAFYSANPVDGGGNPLGMHGLVTEMVALNGVTTANCDAIGVNTAMLIRLEENSINTSGAFGLGFTALALPCVVETHTGSTLDFMSGATYAINLAGSSTGGTIDTLNLCRSVVIPNGITTINKSRGFFYHEPFGGVGTERWGAYMEPVIDNFFGGMIKVGGTVGSTDKVSSASIALEIDHTDRVIRLKPLTTAEIAALTPSEGMLAPNSTTNKMQAYMGGAWVDLH